MKRKVGVLFDGFDPVNADHLDAALSEARNSGFAIVLMGLQPGKSKESCIDRWRMLVASCSDSRLLVPVMTEQECNADRMKFLQGKYPDDDLVMIGGTEELPSADLIGYVTDDSTFTQGTSSVSATELLSLYEGKLEPVYPCNIAQAAGKMMNFSYQRESESKSVKPISAPSLRVAKPRVLIPAFPGTNCEVDSARAIQEAGGEAEIFVVRNLSSVDIAHSVETFAERLRDSQMVFIPGGFSGGDEPDGSGKFITAFFRNQAVREGVMELLDTRGGLMCGICNGFQALIKLGLVPYGKIIDTDEHCPTLTFNRIGRHQSRIVHTRISSNMSPWLSLTHVGEVYSVPISHGEGRFLAEESLVRELASNGQIATQYVDLDGNATADVHFNPNGSIFAIEGITSPDGRVFGKMGHAERVGPGLYQNVPGNYELRMFEAAVKYFK